MTIQPDGFDTWWTKEVGIAQKKDPLVVFSMATRSFAYKAWCAGAKARDAQRAEMVKPALNPDEYLKRSDLEDFVSNNIEGLVDQIKELQSQNLNDRICDVERSVQSLEYYAKGDPDDS